MPLTPPIGFCQAEILLTSFNTSSLSTTIRYYVPAPSNQIAGIVVNGSMTIPQIQTLLTNDPVRTASGYTITVTSFNSGGLTVIISKPSTSQIVDNAYGKHAEETENSPFTCNLKKKKNHRIGTYVGCPCEIYFKEDIQYPQVKYCNAIYDFYGVDTNGFLHYISSQCNIALRGTKFWWMKNACPDEIFFKADIQHPQVAYCNQLYYFSETDENGLFHYTNSK